MAGVVLNAGGGGGSNPTGLTVDGVTNKQYGSEHAYAFLVDELLIMNKISGKTASVICILYLRVCKGNPPNVSGASQAQIRLC